jgi:hypothetical protein
MERWFQARWSPVGGRCGRAPAYIVFCEPDPNFIRLLLCDKAFSTDSAKGTFKEGVHYQLGELYALLMKNTEVLQFMQWRLNKTMTQFAHTLTRISNTRRA